MADFNQALKKAVFSLAAFFITSPSSADVQFDISGFGTIGYAVSDSPYNYLKYIDNEGTFYQDSILGGQLDIRANSKWSGTIQLQVESDTSKESGWTGDIAWAFLSYRPTNDWLFRAGKLRIPGYLNSENRDVGVTYDYIRIPAEFDSLSPTYDFTGLSVNKSFFLEDNELYLDAYYGRSDLDWRTYMGETDSALYYRTQLELLGTAVTYQTTENTYIAGLHYAINRNKNPSQQWYNSPVYQDLGYGEGYYSFEGAEPADSFYVYIATVSADILLGYDIRMAAEFAARKGTGDFINGQNGYTGYVSFRKKIGNWTPYVFYSQIKTDSEQMAFYQTLNSTSVPDYFPSSEKINSAQKSLADLYQAYDQYSIALGSSYSLSPSSKIKAEVMLTHVGIASSLIDTPSDTVISDSNIALFSLSYNFAF